MAWTNRMVCQEGMFLRAQHFQQQDRWLEAVLRGRTAVLRPYPGGMQELLIDRDVLGTGRFAMANAAGVFQDGTPFAVPVEADHPPPLELSESARNVLVYLATTVRQLDGIDIAGPHGDGRDALREFEVYDTHSASPQLAQLQVGRLQLRYLLESDDRSGYFCIGLARIVEVTADRRVMLDERWIAPSLVCSGVRPDRRTGRHAEPARRRAGRSPRRPRGARGVPEVQDFVLLQTINRWQKLLSHCANSGNVHPEDLYATLVQMAGELATFAEASRRAAARSGVRICVPSPTSRSCRGAVAPQQNQEWRSLAQLVPFALKPVLQTRTLRPNAPDATAMRPVLMVPPAGWRRDNQSR